MWQRVGVPPDRNCGIISFFGIRGAVVCRRLMDYIAMLMKLDELAAKIDATIVGGDGSTEITGVAPLKSAMAGQIAFLANPKYAAELETTKASAVIVHHRVAAERLILLKTKDPYYALRQAVVLLHGFRKHPFTGVHPDAHVDSTATIGENTVIYPGVYVGPRAKIGHDCVLYPNVCVYDDTRIGHNVIIHSGASIGVDGFGFATHQGVHHKIPQIGRVVIEDDVEIGANVTIERAALEETFVGQGTKIDQLVVIGHGSRIGAHCLLVAQVGIAGSVTIGHHVVIGGQAGIAGHLNIGDMVQIAAQSGVMTDIDEKSTMIGSPAMTALHARRVYSLFTKLPELSERLREVERRLEALDESESEIT